MDRLRAIEQLPTFAVRRPRLEELLDKVPPGGLGLVVAGAGSGKSVLVSQWIASHPDDCVASMVLTDRHNDPMVLGGELLNALEPVQLPLDPGLRKHLVSGTAGLGEHFFDKLLADLAAQPHDVVIVLDDAHQLTRQELLRDLGQFVDRLPDNVRLVTAARWDPELNLRKLRMSGRLVEVRAADLAFDADEASRMVRSVSGRDLDERQARRLVERTDGWAAGLQIAGISLRAAREVAEFIADFAGTDRLVVEYLTDEVLASLDPSIRSFLLQTAMLPWLAADLCAAVTGRDDAGNVLEFLDDHSLFLIPLDRSGSRFRYHHLFAELLREQAHVELGPDEVRRLRVTAASWFRRRGDVPEAMNQLLDAAAWPDAIELVRTAGHQFFQRGESATLAGWLSRVDREQPDAPAAVGMNLLAAQIAACQFVAAGETYWRIAHRRDTTPAERVAADALYTCCGIDHVPAREVIDVASRVLASLPDVDLDATTATDFLGIGGRDTIEILPASMMGLATFHQGDLAAGAAILEWVRTLQGMQYPIWRVNVLGALALVQAWRGQLTEALRLGSSALEAAAAVGARHHVAVTSARLALGLVSIHRNDLAEAALQLGVAEPLDFRVRGATDHDTRALLTAQLTALTDGPAAALQQLAAPARGAVPPAILHRAERALRAQWQLAAGDPVGARLTLQPDGSDPVAHPMRFDVELSAGDTAAARTVLDRWRPDASNFLETTSHAVRRAALLEAEGETEPAARTMLEAVALAEPEGLLRPLLDYPGAVTLIALVRQKRTSPFITRLVEADRAALERRSGQSHLVDPLTARELELLVHLPTRMSNADIGRATYMSVNTVKTHLRRIYRKLDVNDRDAAVERAKSLGLL